MAIVLVLEKAKEKVIGEVVEVSSRGATSAIRTFIYTLQSHLVEAAGTKLCHRFFYFVGVTAYFMGSL